MRHIKLHMILLLLIAFSISCNKSKKDVELEYLNQVVEDLKISPNIKWVVILPGTGCPGCISEGELFLKENGKNPKFLFVLTKIQSVKLLKSKTGIDIKNSQNIYIAGQNV